MKKLLLLLAMGSIASNVGAQEMAQTAGRLPGDKEIKVSNLHQSLMNRFMPAQPAGAAKTTFTGGRWYNYGIYMTLMTDYQRSVGGPFSAYVDQYFMPIWNDTIPYVGYSSGAAHINMPSICNVLDPTFAGFNASLYYGTGTYMQVQPKDAYTVDSVVVPGFYFGGTKATLGHVDTLRLTFMYGTGGNASTGTSVFGSTVTGGHYVTANYASMRYDSTLNTAVAGTAGGPAYTQDILLFGGDTSNSSIYARAVALTTPINVPAGSIIGTSITYKSGDPAPSLKVMSPGDTIIGAVAPFTRYNVFRPVVDYYTLTDPATVANTTPEWAPYDAADRNTGGFKTWPDYRNGWGRQYVPLWAWSASGGSAASSYQYPEVGYHITCASCNAVSLQTKTIADATSVVVTPNPANDVINVSFSLAQAANVKITLTNLLGQVVATQNLSNIISGKATFNTAALAGGVYVYTLEANGERTTGRVVVAH